MSDDLFMHRLDVARFRGYYLSLQRTYTQLPIDWDFTVNSATLSVRGFIDKSEQSDNTDTVIICTAGNVYSTVPLRKAKINFPYHTAKYLWYHTDVLERRFLDFYWIEDFKPWTIPQYPMNVGTY